ncbi:MAG: FAD/NAD(P)-binding protein [Pseudomonadota bacterium]
MTARTHMIVGDGITALAFLQAVKHDPLDEVILLGRGAGTFGRGAAYAKGTPGTPWQYAYLLNSPADDIDPDFAAWLAARWPDVQRKMAGRRPDWLSRATELADAGDLYGVNAPREFYGDFMEEQCAAALAHLAAAGTKIRRIEDEATALIRTQDGIRVTTAAHGDIAADRVDIAPGGPSTMRIEGDDGPFAVPSVFGFEDRIAERIEAGAEILCIGGNAAMLDVLRLCQSLRADRDIRFVFIAPDGEIPAPLIPRLPRKLTRPQLSAGHSTAESFLTEIRREIDAALAAGDEMREIRAGFRAHFLANPLAGYVTDPNEALKVPGQLRFWLRGGTRDTILDLRRLVEDGIARLEQGLVTRVTHRADGADVHLSGPDGSERVLHTGFAVNCAGAGPGSQYDPLTSDLLHQGLIETCQVTRGLAVGPGCGTADARLRYLSPSVTRIGDEVMAMPLYDAHMLRTYVARAS